MSQKRKRSKLRVMVGEIYYTLKKYYYWYLSRTNFAKKLEKKYLPVEIFSRQTILLRRLKDVDMWMQKNKVINLKIAVKNLNGLVIEPGQIFSFWRQIGRPTKSKGYLKGMVLHNGKVVSGVGGGLCQLSNLIYWMTLHTPLTVIEHWRHSYDVFPDSGRTQPFGSGATVAYPNIDLQIKNNTKQKFQLFLKVTDTHLVGKWLSDKPIEFQYKILEKDSEFKMNWWGGYTRNNKIFRKVIDKNTGKELREEFITENRAITMYNPLLESKEQKMQHHNSKTKNEI